MKSVVATVILCLVCHEAECQQIRDLSKLNFDFELVYPYSRRPHNWRLGGRDYVVSVDSVVKHGGKYSLSLTSPEVMMPNSLGFSWMEIPAIFKGTEIELSAYLKIENVSDGFAGLVLRLVADTVVSFDNMESQKLYGTRDWKKYSVKVPYPETARAITFGPILTGKGRLWVDDCEILIDGVPITKALLKNQESVQSEHNFDRASNIQFDSLTSIQIRNLTALCKVWGFLKYYHPAVIGGKYDWDYELLRRLPHILSCGSVEQRSQRMIEWIDSLKPSEFTGPATVIDSSRVKSFPDLAWFENQDEYSLALQEKLAGIRDARRPSSSHYVDLAETQNPVFRNERSYGARPFSNAAFRLLALFRYWNIIQYFYPYRYLCRKWESDLIEFIPKFVNADSELKYKLSLLELITRINDSHAKILQRDEALGRFFGRYQAPLIVSHVENRAVVTGFLSYALGSVSGLRIGDAIAAINGQEVDSLIEQRWRLTPASNRAAKLREVCKDLLRSNDSVLTVTVENNSGNKTLDVACFDPSVVPWSVNRRQTDTCWSLIADSIGYLNTAAFKQEHVERIVREFGQTKGIILDLRCYPEHFLIPTLGRHLLPGTQEFAMRTAGDVQTPGLFQFFASASIDGQLSKTRHPRVVILVDARTQSQAEYTAMAFQRIPGATTIGSMTAGADGDISFITLPGGVVTSISGIGVYDRYGGETQRIGIAVDIEVKPTIQSIREGRDLVIEKAIEVIRNDQN